MKDRIVIANASGFWGDEADALRRQVLGGHVDYLTMDYLAEITMIILARQKAASEDAGYARDFVGYLAPLLTEISERGITVICNAGGSNPGGCARALEHQIEELGLSLPVAIVDGDDLLPRLPEMVAGGAEFPHLDSAEPLGELLPAVTSAHAYIGAQPIVAALQRGARIVVTGRTYDAASVLAPMVHEFDWSWDDYDKLASGLAAGHLIECGAQATGGNFTGWRDVRSFDDMGYPLVEVEPGGAFVLTKHAGTGGVVSTRTATEQILYEIGDPRAYRSPDVIADFTSLRLTDDGPDRVRVEGARGQKPSGHLKVSMTYEAGLKSTGMIVVCGPDAVAKARTFAEIFWSRVGDDFIETRTDLLGHSACWGESAAPPSDPNEVVLRLAARSRDPKALAQFGRALAGIALAGPPGICGAGARPKPQPAVGYWPALVARDDVVACMFMAGCQAEFPATGESGEPERPEPGPEPQSVSSGERVRVPLARVAYARSGDKGDLCNVGVAALEPRFYPEILRELTAERVGRFFSSNVRGEVARYRLDNLSAVNFVMQEALGGGGTVSLMVDAQGKTISQGLLNMEIEVGADLLTEDEARRA